MTKQGAIIGCAVRALVFSEAVITVVMSSLRVAGAALTRFEWKAHLDNFPRVQSSRIASLNGDKATDT